MKLAFFLSGENVELAKWEVLRLAESYGEIRDLDLISRLLLLDWDGRIFFNRLALTHEVSEVAYECGIDELEIVFREISVPTEPCCVRVRSFVEVDRMKLERELGEILWKRGAKISVSRPSTIFRVYVMGEKCIVGWLRHVTDKKQFLTRRPDKRPFFMPSVVLPKFARALVNLSGAKSKLIDPMCGTGSFIIESSLMGINSVGMDIFEKIARGCAENLEFYSVKADVIVGDARKTPFKDCSFEAVVTDYPYLRSTKTTGKLDELYRESADEFARILKDGCYAVIVTNINAEEYFKEFSLIAKFKQRVHSSLTRRIYLLKKGKA